MALQELVDTTISRLKKAGTDVADVEVKRARGGSPQTLASTVSAFSNGDGGLIILGLSEEDGFIPVPIDARATAVALGGVCRDEIVPSVNADIDIVSVDGMPVVAAVIPAGQREQLPYHVKTQGMERGSYIRGWDGDRHLTTYEVHAMLAGRGQPRDDAAIVPEAAITDLDPSAVAALLTRLRSTRGKAFADATDDEALEFVRVLDRSEGRTAVTLAGLMALGRYPQRYYPQLNVTFVSFATKDGTPMPDGTRFLDNAAIDGSIPVMIEETVSVALRNMTRRSVVVGVGRTDYWEYPEEAVRELVANALMHREYNPLAHGVQVRVELFPDRLEVISPGGLFGSLRPDMLGAETVTSSRNAVLGRLLEDIRLPDRNQMVCENRGTGLLAVSASLRTAGMEPTTMRYSLSEFRSILRRGAVLNESTEMWLSTLPLSGVTQRQRLCLAYLRREDGITNSTYRALTGCDAPTAANDLKDLSSRKLLTRDNLGKTPQWRLNPLATQMAQPTASTQTGRKQEIIALLRNGPLSTSKIAELLGISTGAVRRHITELETTGIIVPTSKKKSPKNMWTLA